VDIKKKLKPQTVGAVPGEGALSRHGSVVTAAGSETPRSLQATKRQLWGDF